MKQKFIDWNPSERSLLLLANIDEILVSYRKQGYQLTLRQLYYQLVSRDLIPNNVKSYNSIGDLVSNARLAGLIDWEMIEDRSRSMVKNAHWDSPADILLAASKQYYRDRWEGQANYVEVWCEKDAVSNILAPVCREWDVIFMANRGYSSQSAMYEAYLRLDRARSEGKEVSIIYFGDHDPSGIDMTRDIQDRMGLFLQLGGKLDSVDRVALNMPQVEEYQPPENPAKMSDSRFAVYVERFGDKSWELDALEPRVLANLVEDAIKKYVDEDGFHYVETVEQAHKTLIRQAAAKLEDV